MRKSILLLFVSFILVSCNNQATSNSENSENYLSGKIKSITHSYLRGETPYNYEITFSYNEKGELISEQTITHAGDNIISESKLVYSYENGYLSQQENYYYQYDHILTSYENIVYNEKSEVIKHVTLAFSLDGSFLTSNSSCKEYEYNEDGEYSKFTSYKYTSINDKYLYIQTTYTNQDKTFTEDTKYYNEDGSVDYLRSEIYISTRNDLNKITSLKLYDYDDNKELYLNYEVCSSFDQFGNNTNEVYTAYDAIGQIIRHSETGFEYEYNSSNSVTQSKYYNIDEQGNKIYSELVENVYDDNNNLLTSKKYYYAGEEIGYLYSSKEYTYDNRKNITSEVICYYSSTGEIFNYTNLQYVYDDNNNEIVRKNIIDENNYYTYITTYNGLGNQTSYITKEYKNNVESITGETYYYYYE